MVMEDSISKQDLLERAARRFLPFIIVYLSSRLEKAEV